MVILPPLASLLHLSPPGMLQCTGQSSAQCKLRSETLNPLARSWWGSPSNVWHKIQHLPSISIHQLYILNLVESRKGPEPVYSPACSPGPTTRTKTLENLDNHTLQHLPHHWSLQRSSGPCFAGTWCHCPQPGPPLYPQTEWNVPLFWAACKHASLDHQGFKSSSSQQIHTSRAPCRASASSFSLLLSGLSINNLFVDEYLLSFASHNSFSSTSCLLSRFRFQDPFDYQACSDSPHWKSSKQSCTLPSSSARDIGSHLQRSNLWMRDKTALMFVETAEWCSIRIVRPSCLRAKRHAWCNEAGAHTNCLLATGGFNTSHQCLGVCSAAAISSQIPENNLKFALSKKRSPRRLFGRMMLEEAASTAWMSALGTWSNAWRI